MHGQGERKPLVPPRSTLLATPRVAYRLKIPTKSSDRPRLLTVREVVESIGVSLATLCWWNAARRFKARRHPINRSRIDKLAEVERLRRKIEPGSTVDLPQ